MGLAHGHEMLLRMCWVCTWHTIRHSLVVCCASIPANKIYILYIIHLALFRIIPHNNNIHDMQQLYNLFLVGGFNPLKNISWDVLTFPIHGKMKFMFQTTNQVFYGFWMGYIIICFFCGLRMGFVTDLDGWYIIYVGCTPKKNTDWTTMHMG
jgi:hypothetical protein